MHWRQLRFLFSNFSLTIVKKNTAHCFLLLIASLWSYILWCRSNADRWRLLNKHSKHTTLMINLFSLIEISDFQFKILIKLNTSLLIVNINLQVTATNQTVYLKWLSFNDTLFVTGVKLRLCFLFLLVIITFKSLGYVII